MSATPIWPLRDIEVEKVKPHPRNFDFVSPPTDVELEELIEDMRQHGQRTPIEVIDISQGTHQGFVLVKGARRTQAAKNLGWTQIQAIVRADTSDPNEPNVLRDLINDNLIRQQLDDLALARCYRGLKELAKKDPAVGKASRDRLAERIRCGKSGRQMERLEALLELPRDIQDMISMKQLSKSDGEKMLKLDSATQQQVFAKLREGILPKHVMKKYGVIESINHSHPEQIARKLMDRIGKDITTLRRRMTDADGLFVRCEDYVDSLESYSDFFAEWNEHVAEIVT